MAEYSIKAGDVELFPDKDANTAKTVWDVKWLIKERKDEKRHVGSLWFNGVPEMGVVDMNFSIESRFWNREYAREALRAIIDWVFDKKDLYEIKITIGVEEEDKAAVLQRSGFVFRRGNKVDESYSIVKPRTVWTGLYVPIGIVAGIGLGVLFDSMIVGLAVGVVIGLVVGVILDTRANAERTKITGEKRTIRRKAVLEYGENDEKADEKEK